jgi:hypothetical protein
MSYDVTDLDSFSADGASATSMGWSSRGGIAATNDATDRFLMRLAITTLNLEEMEMRHALPFPAKAREALGALACYLHDIGYISDEAIERIKENAQARDEEHDSHNIEFADDVVLL